MPSRFCCICCSELFCSINKIALQHLNIYMSFSSTNFSSIIIQHVKIHFGFKNESMNQWMNFNSFEKGKKNPAGNMGKIMFRIDYVWTKPFACKRASGNSQTASSNLSGRGKCKLQGTVTSGYLNVLSFCRDINANWKLLHLRPAELHWSKMNRHRISAPMFNHFLSAASLAGSQQEIEQDLQGWVKPSPKHLLKMTSL